MRLSAAIDVASKRIRRELDTQLNNRKSIIFAMASVFLVGSFFYSLAQVTAYKTSLSPLAEYFPVKQTNNHQYFTNPANAQELGNQELASEIEQLICRETPPTLSVSDPNLELYRLQELCQAFNTVENYFAFENAATADPNQIAFRQELEKILIGTPMEAMIEPISQKDRTVGAFLVGIAFKESTLGKFSPAKTAATATTTGAIKATSIRSQAVMLVSLPHSRPWISSAPKSNHMSPKAAPPQPTLPCGNAAAPAPRIRPKA